MPLHSSKIMPKSDELEKENCNLETKPFAFNAVEPGHLRSKMLTAQIIAFIYSACLTPLPRELAVSIQAFVRRKETSVYFSCFRLK